MPREPSYMYKTVTAEKDGPLLPETTLTPFPPGITPAEWIDHLVEIYGAPIDKARTATDELGPVDIGWVFEAPAEVPTEVPLELIIIPMMADPEDPAELVSWYVYQEQLRHDFISMMAENGVKVRTIDPASGHEVG